MWRSRYVNSIINNIYIYRNSIYVCRHKNLQRYMVCLYRTAYFRNSLALGFYGYKTINGGLGMKRIIAIMKFPIYAMTVLLFILSILVSGGILWVVRLKPSDFDNLPKFLQDKAMMLSDVVESFLTAFRHK